MNEIPCAYCGRHAFYTSAQSTVARPPMCTAHYQRWLRGYSEEAMRAPVRSPDNDDDIMLAMQRAGVTKDELREMLSKPHGCKPDFQGLIDNAKARTKQ